MRGSHESVGSNARPAADHGLKPVNIELNPCRVAFVAKGIFVVHVFGLKNQEKAMCRVVLRTQHKLFHGAIVARILEWIPGADEVIGPIRSTTLQSTIRLTSGGSLV